MINKYKLLISSALMLPASVVYAFDEVPAAEPSNATGSEVATAADIIVNGAIAFRNRTEDTNPILSYDLDYFQRFEPVSVGEMLKRVPGVTFSSDVLEYDGAQMRGLPSGFTNITINGRRAPGGEADRSFFVDRIPAELVERIEIVRSPTADRSSEGVAGTLNIITKDSAAFQGGFIKGGALINEDGKVRPSGAVAYATEVGSASSFWGALNYQERRNPKKKSSDRYDGDLLFNNRELQDDTRDGSDLSANAEFATEFAGGGKLRLRGLYIDTDRDENEVSTTYVLANGDPADFGELYKPDQSELVIDNEDDEGIETQHENIDQQTYQIALDSEWPVGPGKLGIEGSWNGYREDTTETVQVGPALDALELDGRTFLDTKDDEYQATAYYKYENGPFALKAGIDFLNKKRDGSLLEEGEEDDPAAGAIFAIKEERYDPYLRVTYQPSDELSLDGGLRYEITRRTVRANDEGSTSLDSSAKYNAEMLNPSFSVRYAPTSMDQFRASIARTVRRPDYDLIAPYRQEEEPNDDNILIGNPALKNQTSWGVDVGYERRLGGQGIVGINVFYRDIKDLIDLVDTGETDVDSGLDIVTPMNVGDGQTWGVEIDFSAPLTVIGLPDTGVFANYTYLDSETTDPFTGEKRRFNNQPHHVYNIGFIQTVRSIDASFGATLSGRSKALESNFDETIELSYDPDLELFVEKRIGKNFVLRGSVQNLLDRYKKEDFNKWDGDSLEEVLENRANGDLDEFEREREHSGPLFQLTVRAAF